ncbi:hypothetical protein ACFX1Q_043907 [Malus domestica]
MGGNMWQNTPNFAPPTLQLPGSRLKSTLSARDMDFEIEMLSLERDRRRQQRLIDEMSGSPSSWSKGLSPASPFSASGNRTRELNSIGAVPQQLHP